MKTTPYTSGRNSSTLYGSTLEGFDFCARGVEQELDFLLDGGDFEAIERDNFVATVDWGRI